MTEFNSGGAQRLSLTADDDHRILVDAWTTANPQAVIHLFHGLGEHTARYERFARLCNDRGISLYAHSHRGHGEACADEDLGHFADDDGWRMLLDDAAIVHARVQQDARDAGASVIVLGHSMGSYIAQSFLMRGLTPPAALILSASTHAAGLEVRMGRWLAALVRLRGRRRKSPLLNKIGFNDFNKRFAPNRTDYDWLSRDESEVDKYAIDRLCGGPYSAQLWHDLLGGLLEIGSRKSIQKIPFNLPILITGGSDDPVGGRKGMTRLAERYTAAGHQGPDLKIYDGGRHEMLNETNRDEFSADLLDWIDRQITRSE